MLFFGKTKKKEDDIPAPAPKPAVRTELPPPPKGAVSADDFFNDIDKRKNRKREVSFDIDTPEVTGLREAPPPPPKKQFRDVDTDSLSAEGLHEEGYVAADMKNFRSITPDETAVEALRDKTHDNDIPFDPDASEEIAEPAVFDPNDPDAFFRSVDRRKNRRQRFAIDLPDVSSLREEAPVAEEDTVAGIDLSGLSTDSLRDEPLKPEGKEYRNISEISAVVPDDM